MVAEKKDQENDNILAKVIIGIFILNFNIGYISVQ